MNIAHLLPHSAKFPLAVHNGRYEWALELGRHQAAAGHQVTLFAAPGSQDASPISWRSIEPVGDTAANNRALIAAAFDDPSFDLFHSHYDFLPHTLANRTTKPLITTQHWFPTPAIAEGMRQHQRPDVLAVPVSQLMAAADDRFGIHHSDVIYHGVDLSLFALNQQPRSGRLLFVGRISPQKGVKEAVTYAKQAGVGLDIVGKVTPKYQDYWQEIEPLVDGEIIKYHGSKPHPEVVAFMQNASALLFPALEPEAFGLVTVEAQACGTPVIISDVGASRELVIHGKTGFVCSSPKEFLTAIKKVDALEPTDCRKNAERFDVRLMQQNYEVLYKKLAK